MRTALQIRPADALGTESDGSVDLSSYEYGLFARLNKFITMVISKDLWDAIHWQNVAFEFFES